MKTNDLIKISSEQTNAAIVVDQGLFNNALVTQYTPTQSTIQVFGHLCKAVLPGARQEERAINLYGSYGSGKSHLAVVLAQLLKDGAHTPGFNRLYERLQKINQEELAEKLKNTFLGEQDSDARPYLLVSLYASGTTSLGSKLMEGLYDALERHPTIEIKEVLPSTEYDVCVKRLEEILEKNEKFINADLSQWGLDHYLSTDELLEGLKLHQPNALNVFMKWHEAVCFGQTFNIKSAGGKNHIEAYSEAGMNLAEKYHYSGIAVVWDEFGNALEDLIGNPNRSPVQEIVELQEFVESVCTPERGHTLFIGVTHVSFQEYGERTHANTVVKEGLAKISGRFNRSFKIELNASESEGYHLLGMQKTWTEQGKNLIGTDQPRRLRLIETCKQLPMFDRLHDHLHQLVEEVYPLHPVMAVGLFNLSRLAQANRTALTFFRDNAASILNREVAPQSVWNDELVRLPELVEYYSESLKKDAGADWRRYEQALGHVTGHTQEETVIRKDLLRLLLLAQLLGENFKASEEFLACALLDTLPNSATADAMHKSLAWLKNAGLIWKNSVTNFWLLAGEGGVDPEALIEKGTELYSHNTIEELLDKYPEMKDDLFPTLGVHDLGPSKCGIIRSYKVEILSPHFSADEVKARTPLISGRVYLVLARATEEADACRKKIQEMTKGSEFFWLPKLGINSEVYRENNAILRLEDLLFRYLSIKTQLKQGSALSEDLRRQLDAKWERNRQVIVSILQNLFGRSGLDDGKCHIYQSGEIEPIECKSWYRFKELQEEWFSGIYSREVPVRAMNMNGLNDESYCGSLKVERIVRRIIEFDENPTYQTDLLGETRDSSEQSALVDGILGANNLLIKGSTGWVIKTIDETSGPLNEVLKLIRDTLLRKRENPYAVADLRKKLISAPYGLPACTLPIFAAVAIRDAVKRLRWGKSKDNDFSKNLVSAFEEGNELTIRLYEFGNKQFAMLFIAGRCLGLKNAEDQSNDDYAQTCAASIREFVVNQPVGVKASNKLSVKTQQLVTFCNRVGQSAQDLADFLIELLDSKNDLPDSNVQKVIEALQDLFNDFIRVQDAKLHELKTNWEGIYPLETAKKLKLIRGLEKIRTSPSKVLHATLSETKSAQEVDVRSLLKSVLGKSFEECSDSDIGRFIGTMGSLFEQADVEIEQPDDIGVKPYPPLEPIDSPELLARKIKSLIKISQLSKSDIERTLQSILSEDFA